MRIFKWVALRGVLLWVSVGVLLPFVGLKFCDSAFSKSISQEGVNLNFPGVPIAHSDPRSGIYLGTPSVLILESGEYLISHDTFGPQSNQDAVEIYRSANKGLSWEKLITLHGQYYSSLFSLKGVLYIIGISRYEGVPVIRRSLDGGKTWSVPSGPNDGVLASAGKYFSAAVPVVVANNRIWRTMETIRSNGVWAGVMSASVNSDLMQASSWTFSSGLGPHSEWLKGKFNGWLEGNVVVAPSGQIVDILRVYYNSEPEKAAIATIAGDGRSMSFDPETGFINMPGGGKKFTVRYDAQSKRYWSLTNAVTDRSYGGQNFERARNLLELISSQDLHHWETCRIVLYSENEARHGFQYVDWVFDRNDIVAAVRTAFDDDAGGAHSQHDSNYISFLRVAAFRSSTCE